VLLASLGFNLATPWVALAFSNEQEFCACCKAQVCPHRKARVGQERGWNESSPCGPQRHHEKFTRCSEVVAAPPAASAGAALSLTDAQALPDLAWAIRTCEFSLYQRPPPDSLA
jgi:hypothetical protein